MKKIRLATVFSGIGAIEQAMHKMKIDYDVVFACDNGERELKLSFDEIEENSRGFSYYEKQQYVKSLYDETGKENYVKQSYFANYTLDEESWHEDIRFVDGNRYRNCIDLFVGGSPCQSFSISGKRKGLEDTRGTLFYDFARLVKEIQPKVFIYENVPGMLSHDGGKTWEIISETFDELGYSWKLFKLNAKDYGIPQNRTRIYVVGFRNDLGISSDIDVPQVELTTEIKDYLEEYVDDAYYHGEKGFKWITKPKSLEKRVSINGKIARTQAANQQFNWCGDMIFEKDPSRVFPKKVYRGQYKGEFGVARKLTPRECLRLMGFSDDFKIVVEDNKMYRQSGNSIVVNVLQAITKSILGTGVFNE